MSEIDELKTALAALTDRVGSLENGDAIRKLHYAYAHPVLQRASVK